VCNESGCESCGDKGVFEVDCPREFVGELAAEINIAAMCKDGIWPVSGGLLDQSNWFVELHQMLNAEQNRNEFENMERKSGE